MPTSLIRQLRAAGYKITPPRLAVLEVIQREGEHLNPNEILAHAQAIHPQTGRATVYRTLELLTQLGIVRPIYVGDSGPTYIRAQEAIITSSAHAAVQWSTLSSAWPMAWSASWKSASASASPAICSSSTASAPIARHQPPPPSQRLFETSFFAEAQRCRESAENACDKRLLFLYEPLPLRASASNLVLFKQCLSNDLKVTTKTRSTLSGTKQHVKFDRLLRASLAPFVAAW
ncbi:MAG: transcriptional repressor [Anaerolineales bacterium]|nr:transcriptional repressor [Anaerolineales bacterium]